LIRKQPNNFSTAVSAITGKNQNPDDKLTSKKKHKREDPHHKREDPHLPPKDGNNGGDGGEEEEE